MTDFTPALLPVCREATALPLYLIPLALAFGAPRGASTRDVEMDLRCVLQAHTSGDHRAFVMHLDGPDTGSVWTDWNDRQAPLALAVLPDCQATDDGEACCGFAAHPGAHSYRLTDPWDH